MIDIDTGVLFSQSDSGILSFKDEYGNKWAYSDSVIRMETDLAHFSTSNSETFFGIDNLSIIDGIDCVEKMDFQSVYEGVINYYIGKYSDDETFAQYMLEESIPESLPNYIYIDWETTARNLMYDYFESLEYYFRS